MNEDFYNLIINKYSQLNLILEDVVTACQMERGEQRDALVSSIKDRTNHTGIHYTPFELMQIFVTGTYNA